MGPIFSKAGESAGSEAVGKLQPIVQSLADTLKPVTQHGLKIQPLQLSVPAIEKFVDLLGTLHFTKADIWSAAGAIGGGTSLPFIAAAVLVFVWSKYNWQSYQPERGMEISGKKDMPHFESKGDARNYLRKLKDVNLHLSENQELHHDLKHLVPPRSDDEEDLHQIVVPRLAAGGISEVHVSTPDIIVNINLSLSERQSVITLRRAAVSVQNDEGAVAHMKRLLPEADQEDEVQKQIYILPRIPRNGQRFAETQIVIQADPIVSMTAMRTGSFVTLCARIVSDQAPPIRPIEEL